MGDMTLAELGITVLAFASAFVLLANAASVIVKVWKAWKAPSEAQNEAQNQRMAELEKRLDDQEKWRKEVDGTLTRDHKHLTHIDEGTRVTQRALLALLDHGIDGNNITQMQHAKEELQDHLINR